MILVIRDLQRLPIPEEVNDVPLIRKEVQRSERDEGGLRANDISDVADANVGNETFIPKRVDNISYERFVLNSERAYPRRGTSGKTFGNFASKRGLDE